MADDSAAVNLLQYMSRDCATSTQRLERTSQKLLDGGFAKLGDRNPHVGRLQIQRDPFLRIACAEFDMDPPAAWETCDRSDLHAAFDVAGASGARPQQLRWPGEMCNQGLGRNATTTRPAQRHSLTFSATGARLDVASISTILQEFAVKAYKAEESRLDEKATGERHRLLHASGIHMGFCLSLTYCTTYCTAHDKIAHCSS